ncbi:MAG TPA: hypothetical protein VGM33_01925 [Baekduia sp.]|jgi:hypothetical protein
MTLTQRLCATAASLCVAMVALSPSTSLAGDQHAAAAKTKAKCKKGYVRKGSKCTKKKAKAKAPLSVPADGSYSGTGGLTFDVTTTSGKRYVSLRARIPLTCPSGPTTTVGFLVRLMPLTGTTFTGQSSADPEFGQTTMSGTFASAKSLHLTAQVANYKNGSDLCTGQLDVTTPIQAGP